MPFKKLIEPLKDALIQQGFEKPLPFQQKILSKIKSGANLFAIAPKGSGKTTSIILSVVQKLKGEAVEDAPRALILVKDKQAALDLEAAFSVFIRGTYLRLYCAHEEDSIDDQKDDIYDGTDIVIATPQRLNKIFYLNGINLNKLQICIVDDAEFLLGNNDFTEVSRTSESIGKCQYLIFAKKFDQRFERWQDTFMNNAQIITL